MKMNKYLTKIKQIAKELEPKKITIMEVCGGHTNTIMKYAIRDILPKNINLISGPGCPVCVTAQEDIDNMIAIALSGVKVATFGDMMYVKGTNTSLAQAKQNGADILIVTDVNEMLKEKNKDRIFFAIGFETTTPVAALLLQNNISIYPANKIMIPPMQNIVKTGKIDGFILPGHVSAIIGSNIWKQLKKPQVISGFKKDQIIRTIYKLSKLIKENKNEVINDYSEVVKEEGNQKIRKLIRDNMKLSNGAWRGFGVIKDSIMIPKNNKLNAKIKYKEILKNIKTIENKACKCSDIIKGIATPKDCKLFGKICTPKNPIGACMVSETEGACGIEYKYNKN